MRTRTLASVIAGTLVCLALTSAAAARDCRDETPLPADVDLIAPAAGVPPAVARFAGVWIGPWLGPGGDETACATLVVEEILPGGHARLVYSVGAWEPHEIRVPRYWRASGRIVDGELRFALSNGVTAFRFTDAAPRDAGVEGLILAGEAVRPLCTPAGAATTAPPPAPLTAMEVSSLLAGRTLQGDFSRVTIDRSGTLTFDSAAGVDVGRWHVTADGRFCRAWHVGDRGRLRCHHVHHDGDDVELRPDDRWYVLKYRRLPVP